MKTLGNAAPTVVSSPEEAVNQEWGQFSATSNALKGHYKALKGLVNAY